jgi:O-antigen ligase
LLCLIAFNSVKRILPKGKLEYWFSLILGLGVTASVLFFFFLPAISPDNQTLTTFTGRSALWTLILEDWNSNGIFGHGPNTLTSYSIEHIYFPFAHAHNSLLQLLWDFGVLGILSFVLLIWSSCFEASNTEKGRNEVMGLILTLMCIQTEPTMQVGINLIGWYWLIPLLYVYSSTRDQVGIGVPQSKKSSSFFSRTNYPENPRQKNF